MNARSFWIARVMGGLLICASGAMPIQTAQAMTKEEAATDLRQHCSREFDAVVFRGEGDPVTRRRDFVAAWIARVMDSYYDKKVLEEAVRGSVYGGDPELSNVIGCLFKRRLSQLSNASTTASTAPAPWPQRPAPNPREDDAVVFSAAVAYAQKRQADIDRAREGKPKRHKIGAEAHHCLKPQPGGGVVNDCPYAVEYSYCVFHPIKDSWSAMFNCEDPKGIGSWQIGRGPNNRSIMHTGGEMTYWFACRYGETLSKPDGISPGDIEFQRGRGLVGRCGEW